MHAKLSRPSALAGTWYSAKAGALKTEVQQFLDRAQTVEKAEFIAAVIVPHAGYRYSGSTAAYAYKLLQALSFERIFILAPSHYSYFKGAALTSHQSFDTPLGGVPVDTSITENLLKSQGFCLDEEAHRPEHAIEIQLPFLQFIYPHPKIVPILISELDANSTARIVDALKPYFCPENLFIVSSDFTHYGQAFGYHPFLDHVAQNIENLDSEAIRTIEAKDPGKFSQFLEKTEATICGRNPISILLHCLDASHTVRLERYTNSGALTGDYSHSVSYATLIITRAQHP
jgi:AmmeMemoRadiSam system protein B